MKVANVLEGILIVVITEDGTKKEFREARFLVHGFRYILNPSMAQDVSTESQYLKTCIMYCCTIRIKNFSTQVTQAYLHSAEKIMREVFMNHQKNLFMRQK